MRGTVQNALRDRTSQVDWKLAKYDHYRDFDTVVDSQFRDYPELAGRDDQHHDARRARICCRYPGGRCNRDNPE
jgi:hypothetical protein